IRAIIFAVLVPICFAISPANDAGANESLTVITDWAPYGVHGPLFLAAQKGWFKEAGLEGKIIEGEGTASSIQLLAANKADVAFAQLSTMAAAIDKGLPIISIACFVRTGDNGIVVPNGSAIRSARDFAGKRIVYASGSSAASLMDAYFLLWGVP